MIKQCPPARLHRTSVVFIFLCVFASARASDYGTTGLIDIPTARFDEDGYFSVAASTDQRHRQFSITYQATPWLQGTFRYVGFHDFSYWDRSYEIKARLLRERVFFPEVAAGIRDVAGTGIFGSEYLVASKQLGRTDVSVGLGWGRLAGKGLIKNPFRRLDEAFSTRSASTGQGGDFNFGDFFSGPEVGLFGGLSHRFDALPITAQIEFNPDQYDWDVRNGGVKPKEPWSIGISWHASPGIDVRLSLQHGDEFGINFRSYLDSKVEHPRRDPEQFISSYFLSPRDLPRQINKRSWYDRLLYDVERSGLLLIEGGISNDGQLAQLVVGNVSYALWSDAIARLSALADLHLPATVRSIYFVVDEAGHRGATLVVPRPSAHEVRTPRDFIKRIRILPGRTLNDPQHRTGFATGTFNNAVNIRTRFQLFDPDDPARYQLYASLDTDYVLNNYWSVRSSIAFDIENNFDESKRKESDSALPKVRSNVARYLADGDSGLEKLLVEGRNSLGRSIHYKFSAGYLETMFAGAAGEILYWPTKSRVAVGVSVAYARQRDYRRRFGFLDYDIVTSHLSAYWATPFNNYDLAIHLGKYLAGDMGATFEARRTFRNGWQVGVWATGTDVSFDEFGEGSFDKGMYFQIPLDSLFGSRTRSAFSTRLRPIQRDGGQRLEDYSGNIFWDLRTARFDSFKIDERLVP